VIENRGFLSYEEHVQATRLVELGFSAAWAVCVDLVPDTRDSETKSRELSMSTRRFSSRVRVCDLVERTGRPVFSESAPHSLVA